MSLFLTKFIRSWSVCSVQASGIFLSALITALGWPLGAIAADAPLTLLEAQNAAVAHSRQIAAQDAAISASRDMAVAAGQLPDPVVKAGIDNLPVNGADRLNLTRDFMTMRRIGVTQEITRGDKRRLRTERFDLSAEKSEAEKIAAMADIERNTALAWLERYYAERMASVLAEQAALTKQELDAMEATYRGGRASQADVLAARSSLAAIEDRQSELAQRIANAKIRLARWTGLDIAAPLAGAPPIDMIRLDPATLDVHFVHHPEIMALSKQAEIADTEAKLAQADKKADWSVEVAYSQRGPGYSNMVSVGVSVPLQWNEKNRQDREWSAKRAMMEQAQAERDEMLREHIANTRVMINEWQNNRDRLVRYRHELVPLAHDRATATAAAYRGGKASLTDTLAVQRNETDVKLQALQLEADTARLWAQINFLFPNETAHLHGMPAAKDLP